ncbi:hypothetical protein GCM10018772_04760 [Streptomyces fumanus]|uniref:HTH cro/C1-type domain-containing protein n=1 Tax=Streptomyces fumanus TaxID=67302 RepID=A0A919A342_9ACTN|nr:hypothetical protein GCM10018772_04760 [Streptomyces fumanus]
MSGKLDKLCTKCDASSVRKRGHERRTVEPRYRLHSGDLLRRLIDDHRSDEPGSVRELAAAVGLSKSKIQALVNEERSTVAEDEAARLAQAYRLPPRALVHPVSVSADMDKDYVTSRQKEAHPHGPHGAHAARPSRRAYELGEHARPEEPDGEGACRSGRPV